MKFLAVFLIAFLSFLLPAKETVVKEFRFQNPADFQGWGHCWIKDLRVENGALRGVVTGDDGIIHSRHFPEFDATLWQTVEIRMRACYSGIGELYFTNTTEPPYGGFRPNWSMKFPVQGDGEWHTYRICPGWALLKKVSAIRLDFPVLSQAPEGASASGEIGVEYIRILQDEKPPEIISQPAKWDFQTPQDRTSHSVLDWVFHDEPNVPRTFLQDGFAVTGNQWIALKGYAFQPGACGKFLAIRMASRKSGCCLLRWQSAGRLNWCTARIPLHPDGLFHTYALDLSQCPGWGNNGSSTTACLQLRLGDGEDSVTTLASVEFCNQVISPGDPWVIRAGMADALNRAGKPAHFQFLIRNEGVSDTPPGVIEALELPVGVRIAESSGDAWKTIMPLAGGEWRFIDLWLEADAPVSGNARFRVTFPGIAPIETDAAVEFTPSLGLPPASYVPEPKPISTGDFLLGALYFPGWNGKANGGWERIQKRCPERKPLLGWYDEGNPEAIDWQIKWLVENGIQYLAVDWYWSRGHQGLTHWIDGFKKCRYRSYLKWALMWANHNGPGSHSEEDSRKVCRWWCEQYFTMPEYLTWEGKPVVMIWSPEGMEGDMKDKGGVARLNEIFQEEARAAGFTGIYLCAMKWPESTSDTNKLQFLKDSGYDATSIYRYRDPVGGRRGRKRIPFQELLDTTEQYWEGRQAAGILPFFVNITTGWDDRPWNDTLEIYGKTPERFRELCQKAKAFAERTGQQKWLMLGPLNEWGEGSYIEPCTEYGFTMYEALREVFGIRPPEGWPANYSPTDVGRGPYDFPKNNTQK